MRFISLFIIGALMSTLWAATTPRGAITDGKEPITMNFKDLEIDDFVKLVANILEKNILLQAKIPGKVDFVSSTQVYKRDLPAILQSVLASKGYTIVDTGPFMEVVRSKDVSQYNLPIAFNDNKEYMQMITEIIEVKGANVDVVASKIKHLASVAAKVLTVAENNTILITDFPDNIATIKDVVRLVEKSVAKEVAIVPLEHGSLEHVFKNIQTIAQQVSNDKVETERITVLPDVPNNAIIITATSENVAKIKDVITRLDVPEKPQSKTTRVIQLKNSEAKEVIKIIVQVVAAQKAVRGATDQPIVAPDEQTNALVIIATPEDQELIASVIDELDKEQKQVYVKARIIEISETNSKNLGIKYGLEGGEATSNGLYTFAMNMGGSSMALSSTLSSIISAPEDLTSGLAFGAAIDFLATNGAANIVSEPSILALNNLESKIYVGETRSILTSTASGDNANDLTRNNYSRENIGLTLKVKPRISNDGKVTLQIDATIEDAMDSGSERPTTTKREVTTRAIVKNGESVIVGGLIRDKGTETINKIPLLGDIPVLGEVFRHRGDTVDKLNIVIMLTPYIVDKSEDLASLRTQLAELEKIQEDYNKQFKAELEQFREENTKPESKPNPVSNPFDVKY